MQTRIDYDHIKSADLYVDAVYCSPRPSKGGYADDVLTVMLHNCRNTGGFRIPHRKDRTIPYIGLHLCDYEPAWPDSYDADTGILVYYGDNREGGKDVEKTDIGGNLQLHKMFDNLHLGGSNLKEIPPILVFKNTGEKRDVRFLGLAVPGVKNAHSDEYFTTVWRTKNGVRFPNYVAKFTILDLGNEFVSRAWIEALMSDDPNKDALAPSAWINFQKKGLSAVKPLEAPSDINYPGKAAMLPNNKDDMKMLRIIHNRYGKSDPEGFEKLAVKLMYMMDPNYRNIVHTRLTKDGGRDAVGQYVIVSPGDSISVECAMEAKCYDPGKKGVGVRETSRLISRIRNRQFGILITTSYINKQAYTEVKEDKHPIMFCTGKDIVQLLKEKENLNSGNLGAWLDSNV